MKRAMTSPPDELARPLLTLEGGLNFRDMGGYATADGRRVKWRHLYRSGVMAQLTPADAEHLRGLGIRNVIDLRSVREQEREPTLWCAEAGVDYWARPHSDVFGDTNAMLRDPEITEDAARGAVADGFRSLAYQQAPAFAELVRRIAAGRVPIAFNCAAGKDRTGGAAALVLAMLGVPRETILADYMLTRAALDGSEIYAARWVKMSASVAHIPEAVLVALRGVHPEYMIAFFEGIKAQSGSVEGYLGELGFTAGDIEGARGHLLEPG